MADVKTIEIKEIRAWDGPAPLSIPQAPPVTVDIGVPIIRLPSFNPMDYRPSRLVFDPEPVLPKPEPPEPPKAPSQLPIETPTVQAPIDQDTRCPPLRAKAVGTLVDGGKKRIAAYEKGQDGTCKILYENITLSEQVVAAVPSLPQLTTVGVTAVVGVSAGLATPFILRFVKPVVKKAAKKIQGLLGSTPEVLSVAERRRAQRSLHQK